MSLHRTVNMYVYKYLIFVVFFTYKVNALANLQEVFAWKEISFAWPTQDFKKAVTQYGSYDPEHNIPLGMVRWKNKLFLTFPRWKSGVPMTLGYIPLNEAYTKTPLVHPYPSWEANRIPKGGEKFRDDNHIISTFRVTVDACDRLWVVDTGLHDILGDLKVLAPPTVLIYDLNTDKLIRKYVIDPKLLREGPFFVGSFFPNIIVDTNPDQCDDAYAYIPDVSTSSLVVYTFKDNRAWKFTHHFFHFDPLQGDFNTGGINYQWNDGVFGLALSPEDENCFRTVYFHPTASTSEFSVNSAVLKNESLTDEQKNYHLFKYEGNKGEKTQTTMSVYDEKSNAIFLTQLNRDGVACWNPRRPLKPENVALVAQDHEKLVFTNEIRIDDDRYLWILSNRMPEFIYDHLDKNKINFRIFRVPVDDAIAGTPCVA